jgi:phage gpG-like protein
MFSRFDIDFKAESVLRALDLTKKDMNKTAKKCMAGAFQAVRRDIRKGLRGSVLKKRTGTLYKNITYKAKDDYSGYIRIGSRYASMQEEGATIIPRNGKYLRFQIDGTWVTTSKVILPARPFSKPVFNSYFSGSGKAEAIMDAVMQKELEKIFSKA